MDKQRQKELREQAKLVKTYMGVYQITHIPSGKIFVDTSNNLKNQWSRLQGHLDTDWHPNAQLQKDWKAQGAQAFAFAVLEEKEVEAGMDTKWELQQMEKSWLDKLEPYGEKGYNIRKEK